MRCVQVQEMPPNPTHWTFSGLLFSFFLDMFLLHTADSCCLEALCFQEVSFLFSSSVLESRTVWVFVVTDQKCLGCVAFAATPGSIPDAELSCHILLSPLFYVSVCLCCIINILKKCTKKRSEVKVTTTSRLSHSCEWTNTKSVAVVAVFHHKLFSFTGVELQVIVVAPCVKALHQSCSYWNWFTGITHVDTVITFFFFM